MDPRRLERFGVTLQEVFAAIAANNTSFSGGFIEHRSERYTVRGTGLVTGEDDLRRIVIDEAEGVPVLVSDLAEVRIGAMQRQGAVTSDGQGESLAGMVIMLKGENGRDVGARVKARIAEVVGSLPGDVTITPFYDQTEVIDRTSATVRRNLIEGGAAGHGGAVRVPARRARRADRRRRHPAVDAGRLHRHARCSASRPT